jgi:cytochrome bd-type quinol oxidase subunit 1
VIVQMTDLLAARSQMAMSLAFHILFAIAGMAMPLLMLLAEWRHHRTGDPAALDLAKRWAKGTAILFAVGAVSGTVLSFELGLLWPEFMRHAGPLVGMPFSLEGFAFFLEAIFLGLYLYGWDKLSRIVHMWTGFGVALCGLLSAVFVTAVNAWMNDPAGFRLDPATGELVDIDPWAAMFNDAFPTQALHMSLAAYAAVSIAVLGIHAWALRRNPGSALHQSAFRIALGLALVSVPAQIVSGDISAKYVAEHQPTKLAAAEALFHTQARAPLSIGGWPNPDTQTLEYAIEIPGGLSFLAFADFDAQVSGAVGGLAATGDRARGVSDHGRLRGGDVGLGRRGRAVVVARASRQGLTAVGGPSVPARGHARDAARLDRDRSWLGRDRGRSAAVDHPWRHAYRGCRDPDAAPDRAVSAVHRLVRVPRRDRDRAAAKPRHGE